jgi:hypothetical protein
MFIATEKGTVDGEIARANSLERLGRLVYLAGWDLLEVSISNIDDYSDEEVDLGCPIVQLLSRTQYSSFLKEFRSGFEDEESINNYPKRARTQ